MLDRVTQALREVGLDAAVQLLVTLVLFGAVLAVSRLVGVHLGRDPLTAVGRGLVQVLLMGFFLTALLTLHAGWSAPILLAMCAIAADISRRRGAAPFTAAFGAIVLGTAVTVIAMLAMGALEPTIRDVVPVGSIIVATCMRTASLAFERLDREAGRAEAASASVHASLIPAVDGVRSLGLVWIPGIMTGLVLAGVSPVRAAVLQFVVIALGFVAAAVTSLVATAWPGATATPTAQDNA